MAANDKSMDNFSRSIKIGCLCSSLFRAPPAGTRKYLKDFRQSRTLCCAPRLPHPVSPKRSELPVSTRGIPKNAHVHRRRFGRSATYVFNICNSYVFVKRSLKKYLFFLNYRSSTIGMRPFQRFSTTSS